MNKKNNYEQPSAELLVVRFEEAFLQATGLVKSNSFSETANIDDRSSDEDWW